MFNQNINLEVYVKSNIQTPILSIINIKEDEF